MKNEEPEDNSDLNEIDPDDEKIAVGKLEFWHVVAHVHNKTINISVGDACQRIKWLAHVAIARYDENNAQGWKLLGIPTVIRHKTKDGEQLNPGAIIRDVIENGDHIFISSSLSPVETK